MTQMTEPGQPWSLSPEDIAARLSSGASGLSEEEATLRRKQFGPNTIRERRRLGRLTVFVNQFKSPLILILIAAGAGTVVLKEWVETGVIFAAVFANSFLGFWQENKAEEVFETLKSYVRSRVRVRRGANEIDMDAALLVPGDVIRVAQGDRIPADGRILFANNFEADEAILTGESLPSKKTSETLAAESGLGDRTNMVWSGTLAVGGFADVMVTATGDATEFGKIAASLSEAEDEATPLRIAVGRLATVTGAVVLVLTGGIFAWGIFLDHDLFETFLLAVSIAVSAVPEGLPIALTVILAVGAERIGKRKGVIRKLLAAETLGSTTVILTDKTGTLTEARMELTQVLPYGAGGEEAEKQLLSFALLNTDVAIENPDDPPEEWRLNGRGIETALVKGAAARGIIKADLLADYRIADRLPFNSANKYSMGLIRSGSHTRIMLLGAPDVILEHVHMSPAEKEKLLADIDELAYAGKRVLGMAVKSIGKEDEKVPYAEDLKGLSFLGLLCFFDPLRPDIRDTIALVTAAGIRTVIVTGDHRGTAESIAHALGLVDGRGAVVTGAELETMSDEELLRRKENIAVYARVTPEHKVRLARLYHGAGEVVAMIGDGVNDAPALKEADIGVAVGSGTDVAKGAADLVILDDHFSTLVLAIEEGRKILANIRKVIVYLLSNVLDGLFLIGGSLLLGIPLPLSALQILFVNFFADSFPAIAFAFDEEKNALQGRPRKLHRNLFDDEMKFLVLVVGILTSALLFVLYAGLLRAGHDPQLVRTFMFATFATYSLVLAFPLRSLDRPITSFNPFSNMYLVLGTGIGIALTALVVYVPALREVFGTVFLPWPWAIGVLSVGLINVLAVEIGKWLYRDSA